MDRTNLSDRQPGTSVVGYLCLASAMVLACCGRGGTLRIADAGGLADVRLGSGGSGGDTSGAGGSRFGEGGSGAPDALGGAGGARMDALAERGDEGDGEDASASGDGGLSSIDGLCYVNGTQLWEDIQGGVGMLCTPTLDGGIAWGWLVFDKDGRIVDNTGIYDEASRQEWISSLANYRWPCLAGQVLRYSCSAE